MNVMKRWLICFGLNLLMVGCPNNTSDPIGNDPQEPVEQPDNNQKDAGPTDEVIDVNDAGFEMVDAGMVGEVDSGSLPEAWFACGNDRECVLYEEGCCDHCNGGTLWSVNSFFLNELMTAHPDPSDEECENVMCTRRMCFEMEAICEEGMCASRQKLQNADEPDAGVTGNINDAGNSDELIASIDAGQDNGANTVQDGGTTPTQELPLADAGVSGDGAQAVWFQCALDSECVLHEYGCCDYCAGGNMVSVHEDYLADVQAYYTSPPAEICMATMCITLACLGDEAFCNAGTCDHRPLTFGPIEPVDAGPSIDDEDLNDDGFPDVWFSCTDVSDCIDYQPGCCDYCNGGPIYVVNTDYLSALETAEPPISSEICSNVQCGMQYCMGPNLTCIDNVCGHQD